MSTVIAYKQKDKVIFCTDTVRTYGEYRVAPITESAGFMNVVHMPCGVTVGFTGGIAVKETLVFHPEWFHGMRKRKLTKKLLMQSVVPELFDELQKTGIIREPSDDCALTMDGTFLLAKDDDLFYMDSDFSVYTVGRYAVIGDNAPFATAILDEADGDGDVTEVLLRAARAVAYHSDNTAPPYVVTDTASKTILLTEEETI